MSLYGLARSALFALEAEQAHEATLRALERGLYRRARNDDDAALRIDVGGLRFPNPIGIAAGFDKDARVPDAVLGLGCGFAEIGTVTPRPQPGNPRPRIFRLKEDRAIINRLGFNNAGHSAALERLRSRARAGRGGIVGVNIGANKESTDRTSDYVAGLRTFYDVASYFTVNISSPNTPGLRDLQAPAALDELLGRVMEARARLQADGAPSRPIFVKIAPDIAMDDLPAICGRLVAHAVDGICVSNTTLARPQLASLHRGEAGGLSGRPLFERSTIVLARVHVATQGRVPLIGVGGIDSGAAAVAKMEAGASLLQLYTGLVYEGPTLIADIKRQLRAAMGAAGIATVGGLTGCKAAQWADKAL